MKVKNDHRSKFSNLSNWKEEAWKNNQGFNGIRTLDLRVAGALLYQLSYESTYWERRQFIEFISPVRSEMMWSIDEIIRWIISYILHINVYTCHALDISIVFAHYLPRKQNRGTIYFDLIMKTIYCPVHVNTLLSIQSNLFNTDAKETEPSVRFTEVSVL